MLDLQMNILHGTIPSTFAEGNTFRNINLNGNQLEGLLPQSLANYRNLEVIDLRSNKINETLLVGRSFKVVGSCHKIKKIARPYLQS